MVMIPPRAAIKIPTVFTCNDGPCTSHDVKEFSVINTPMIIIEMPVIILALFASWFDTLIMHPKIAIRRPTVWTNNVMNGSASDNE